MHTKLMRPMPVVAPNRSIDFHSGMHAARGQRRTLRLAKAFAMLAIALVPGGAFGQAAGSNRIADAYYVAVDVGLLPGAVNSRALAVNHDGSVVVGQTRIGAKDLPFVWRNGQLELIGNPASMTTGTARSVTGTRNDFRVVGEYTDAVTRLKRGFVYGSDGTFQDLPLPPGHEQSTAWSINADGRIAGYTYYYVGPRGVTSLNKQAVPVRWDPLGASPGTAYSQPAILYSGPLQDYSTSQCTYTGRGFNMANPIRLNDAPVPTVVTSWNVPTTNCFSLGTNINVLNYLAARPIKHTAGDADTGFASWTTPGQPGFSAYQAYYPNQNNFQYANTYGIDVNDVGTEIHNDVAPLFQPGNTSTRTTGYTWKQVGGTSTYTAATGVLACGTTQTLVYNDINDADEIVGSTNVTGGGTPCAQIARGFVRPLGGALRYLLDRVNAQCRWTRLVPTAINDEGHIAGAGLRDGSTRAFLLIPVATLPADPAEACTTPDDTAPPNAPPLADAGPDQVLEATSPAGAAATLDASASSDPDGDALEYRWAGDAATATGETFSLTLATGVHDFTLTVEDPSGETSSDVVRITVRDTTPPDTGLTATPLAIASAAQASFGFTGSDVATAPEDLRFECSLDGAAWTACASPALYAPGEGSHRFEVRAVDSAGLADPTPASFGWLQDSTPPRITLIAPAQSREYPIGSVLNADYSCADDGSGVASCTGTTPVGVRLDTTSAGRFTFRVDAADAAGNESTRTHEYAVTYGVCSGMVKAAARSGSTVPVKLQACDAAGGNLSSPGLLVTATSVVRVSTNTDAPLADAGNANPDFNFRYAADLFAGAGGYIFNLKTTDFAVGTYLLLFRIGADPVTHAIEFQVR